MRRRTPAPYVTAAAAGNNPCVNGARQRLRTFITAIAAAVGAVALVGASVATAAPTIGWRLVEARPHDPTAFTQGLVRFGDLLIETTGACCPGGTVESTVRKVDPRSGRVLDRRVIPLPLWAEGVTVFRGTAWHLTFYDGVAFSFSPTTLAPASRVTYPFQGWGLTVQGGRLLASDGTPRLRWLRTPDLRVTKSVVVRDAGRPVSGINELEMLGGVLWANVWPSEDIALIDPASGRVRAWLDLSSLRKRVQEDVDVLNGIARDPVTGHVAVTGKFWNRLFVIRLAEPVPPATR